MEVKTVPDDDGDLQRVKLGREHFDQHYLAAERTTIMGLVSTAGVIALLWNDSSRTGLLVWGLLMAIAAPLPTIIKKVRPPVDLWFSMLVPMEIVLGIIWSSIALLAMPEDAVGQVFVGALLVGILLGTPFVLSQFMRTFVAFTVPFTVVSVTGLVLFAESSAQKVIWVLLAALAHGTQLARAQQELQNQLSDSIHENKQLLNSLEATHAQVMQTNESLERTAAAADRLARVDSLTQIPNRLEFDSILTRSLQSLAEGSTHRLTVAFLDLNNFKYVNDMYGHKTGDQLLKAVAARLETTAGPNETIARIGGDELVLVSPEGDPQRTGSRLTRVFLQPFAIDGRMMDISASIGVASTTTPIAADELMRLADAAQYKAKRSGGGAVVV